MKLICYGASVTAQKNDSGYFTYLSKSDLVDVFDVIERITFGASQYEYAGYAFMSDVLEEKPDVCLIDWLTPGMKSFNKYKISLLNRLLLERNCLPIWIFFPRIDNFENLTDGYFQVKNDAKDFGVPFVDLLDYMPNFGDSPEKYLRDKVHTNEIGAKKYSDVLVDIIKSQDVPIAISNARRSIAFKESQGEGYIMPMVLLCSHTIKDENNICLATNWQGGLLEIFLETTVGPHVCLLTFKVFDSDTLIWEQIINPADPWCYYERKMVVETLRKRFPIGRYSIVISKSNGDPFADINLRKPKVVEYDEKDRYLSVERLSINGDVVITYAENHG